MGLPFCLLVESMLGTKTVGKEKVQPTATSSSEAPTQAIVPLEHPPALQDDVFASIFHLDIREDVADLLLDEYELGTFHKVALGSIYMEKTHSIGWRVIEFLLYWLVITFIVVFAFIFLIKQNEHIVTALFFLLGYILIVSSLISSFMKHFNKYRQVGYFFVTDVGLLIIEEGGTHKRSWFYYKDMKYVENCYNFNDIFNSKHVLRIIDKWGHVHEYDREMLDPAIWEHLCPFVKGKLG